jgi:hypothetical protein
MTPMNIPQDMIVEQTKQGGTVVSIRDLLVLLGASEEKLRDMDEQDEILAREPWRRDTCLFIPLLGSEVILGWKCGHSEGGIDWRGTRFHKDTETVWDVNKQRQITNPHEVPKDPIKSALPYVPFRWFKRKATMTEQEQKESLAAWIATRPECVQKLAAEFPPGKQLYLFGEIVFVLGWNEADQVIVSTTNPNEDYDRAVATKKNVCADHVREHSPDELDYKYEEQA